MDNLREQSEGCPSCGSRLFFSMDRNATICERCCYQEYEMESREEMREREDHEGRRR